mgnify:CR=1
MFGMAMMPNKGLHFLKASGTAALRALFKTAFVLAKRNMRAFERN